MALALTCTCGAQLEIDEKFAGQVVPCPDCQRPLTVSAPEPVRVRRANGLAVLAFALALTGGLTLVGSIAAVVLGVLARRRILSQPERFTGLGLARAALVIGGVGGMLSVLFLISPDVLHLDALLREVSWARKLDYTHADRNETRVSRAGSETSIEVPSRRWGSVQNSNSGDRSDDLIIVDPWNDLQIACQSIPLDADEVRDWSVAQEKGLQRFCKSELVALLGRFRGDPSGKDLAPRDMKDVDNARELLLDLRVGGIDRTFLLRMQKGAGDKLLILVGAARKRSFGRAEERFRKTFTTFKAEP